MNIIKQAIAGSLESSDLLVRVSPNDNDGVDIVIDSTVKRQFGEQIKETVCKTLTELGVEKANVVIDDKGALDCIIKARVQAAVLRAAQLDNPTEVWEKLL